MKTQGSTEWHKKRSIHLTASRFGDILARPTTKRYQNYQLEKVNELSGAPYMSDDAPWFRPGKELEPIARERYEFEMSIRGEQTTVKQVFFIEHPEYPFIGCSPDGLVLPNKGIEIKSSTVYAGYLKNVSKGLPATHRPQVQGQIWVCGYDSVDFVCFFRDPDGLMPDEINIINVLPDLKYHKMLEEKCLIFWEEIQNQMGVYNWESDGEKDDWLDGI